MKKSQPLYQQTSPTQGQHSTSTSPAALLETAPTKIARALVYLRHYGSLNRFEAARLVGDTCLNSTIPALETHYGLTFEHIPEKSPNHWSEPCDCTRYRLPEGSHDQADKVLTLMFARGSKRQKVAA